MAPGEATGQDGRLMDCRSFADHGVFGANEAQQIAMTCRAGGIGDDALASSTRTNWSTWTSLMPMKLHARFALHTDPWLKRQIVEPHGLSVTDAAARLHVTR